MATLYIPSLEKVQVGMEAAWGDLAVPSMNLVGITDCKITPKVAAAQIRAKTGDTMPARIATVDQLSGEASVSGVVAYEHLMYWLDGIFGIAGGVSPYAYKADLDASPTVQSFNLVYGQTGVVYSMGGAILDSLNIKGASNGPLTFTAHLLGKGVVDDTLDAGLTDDAVVVAMGNHCALTLDPVANPIGTTALTATAFSFDANIAVDRKLVWHLPGLNPDSFRHGKWGGSLRLVLEMTADTEDIIEDILEQTVSPGAYLVRITATSAAPAHIFRLDMAGHLLTAPTLFADTDGVTSVDLDFTPVYDDDAALVSCWGASLTLP